MQKLHFDIETYSSVSLPDSGAFKYCESIDFEILILAYALNDEKIKVIDLANGEKIPQEFISLLKNPDVIKCAHNATFERTALKAYGFDIPIEEWECSMVKAAYCGLPFSLQNVSDVLKLGDKGKMTEGKRLIRYFSIPCKPTKANCNRKRNLPRHSPEDWELYKTYCRFDVEAEREIDRILENYILPDFEKKNYIIDQKINDLGIKIDLPFAKNAIKIDEIVKKEVKAKVKKITGVENPNSPAQLKEWLSEATGKEIKSLAKDNVLSYLEEFESDSVKEVLNSRLLLSKSSTKKYNSMINCFANDGRAHGLFQFLGANKTGRWTGRLIQLQNLPQNHMKGLKRARDLVSRGNYDEIKLFYDHIPNVLSELIRTAFIAPENQTFVVSDFSAIEARVLSWVAQEEWRLEVFETHGKIYEASASIMFGVPIENVTKGSELRQRGKTAELALGYQGSVGAMQQMDRDGKIPKHELKPIVDKWRRNNPKIVKLWYDVEKCVLHTIRTGKSTGLKFLEFHRDKNALRITLPSGRDLFYWGPKIGMNRWGNPCPIYKGNSYKGWVDIETYGGKLVENIVQAISRDLLAYSMQKLHKKEFSMVMHVHDEVVAEVFKKEADKKLKEMISIMSEDVPWAKGLPLNADGYITEFYKKD